MRKSKGHVMPVALDDVKSSVVATSAAILFCLAAILGELAWDWTPWVLRGTLWAALSLAPSSTSPLQGGAKAV